jgi:hypothetical protein
MDGVNAVDVENGAVAVGFDERKIPEEQVRKLAGDSYREARLPRG